MKFNFYCDYNVGGHPDILTSLATYTYEANIPYGLDEHSSHATKLIREVCNNQNLEVYYLSGGTQVNLTFLSHVLQPYESVIACETGHINVHETGAIEATGHKVNAVKGVNGKMTPEVIEKCVLFHADEHMVLPRVVFISHPSELGTIYSLNELKELRAICDKYQLYLYLDGARLSSALSAKDSDVTLADIAELCDAFYIGGNKCGALFGEALVISNPSFNSHFRNAIKQKGAMLAKGFLIGMQYEVLFKDNLYLKLGAHQDETAQTIKKAFVKKGIELFQDNPTNQIFPILTKKQYDKLAEDYEFSIWEKISDDKIVTRFVTSWATQDIAVSALVNSIQNL